MIKETMKHFWKDHKEVVVIGVVAVIVILAIV